MKGLFDMPKGQFGKDDTNGVFNFNPMTQGQERSWVKYSDGVYEPERKDGSLKRKKDDYREFEWWQVNKPADWKPQDEGASFSWNHTLGAKDDFADQKTGKAIMPDAKNTDKPVKPEKAVLPLAQDGTPFQGKTMLAMGAKALDEPQPKTGETAPSPRNSAQDAAELKTREQLEPSSAEHARDLERLEREQRHADAAASAGALGGMVQSKGQHGKGKLTADDPMIEELKKQYGERDFKKGAKKELNELSKKAKQEKSPKKRQKIINRKNAIKGAIKLMDRFFIRTPLVAPFNKEQMRDIINGVHPDERNT